MACTILSHSSTAHEILRSHCQSTWEGRETWTCFRNSHVMTCHDMTCHDILISIARQVLQATCRTGCIYMRPVHLYVIRWWSSLIINSLHTTQSVYHSIEGSTLLTSLDWEIKPRSPTNIDFHQSVFSVLHVQLRAWCRGRSLQQPLIDSTSSPQCLHTSSQLSSNVMMATCLNELSSFLANANKHAQRWRASLRKVKTLPIQ